MSITGVRQDTIVVPLKSTYKVSDPQQLKPLLEEIAGTVAKETDMRANIHYEPSGNAVGTDGEKPAKHFPGNNPDAPDETATVQFLCKVDSYPTYGSPASNEVARTNALAYEGFIARTNAAADKAIAKTMARLEELGFTPDGLTQNLRGFANTLKALATAKGSLPSEGAAPAANETDKPKAD